MATAATAPEDLDAVLSRMEAAVTRVNASQGNNVKLWKEELELLAVFDEAREIMMTVVGHQADRSMLFRFFGGENGKRVLRVRAALEAVKLSQMNSSDQRVPRTFKACMAVQNLMMQDGQKLAQKLGGGEEDQEGRTSIFGRGSANSIASRDGDRIPSTTGAADGLDFSQLDDKEIAAQLGIRQELLRLMPRDEIFEALARKKGKPSSSSPSSPLGGTTDGTNSEPLSPEGRRASTGRVSIGASKFEQSPSLSLGNMVSLPDGSRPSFGLVDRPGRLSATALEKFEAGGNPAYGIGVPGRNSFGSSQGNPSPGRKSVGGSSQGRPSFEALGGGEKAPGRKRLSIFDELDADSRPSVPGEPDVAAGSAAVEPCSKPAPEAEDLPSPGKLKRERFLPFADDSWRTHPSIGEEEPGQMPVMPEATAQAAEVAKEDRAAQQVTDLLAKQVAGTAITPPIEDAAHKAAAEEDARKEVAAEEARAAASEAAAKESAEREAAAREAAARAKEAAEREAAAREAAVKEAAEREAAAREAAAKDIAAREAAAKEAAEAEAAAKEAVEKEAAAKEAAERKAAAREAAAKEAADREAAAEEAAEKERAAKEAVEREGAAKEAAEQEVCLALAETAQAAEIGHIISETPTVIIRDGHLEGLAQRQESPREILCFSPRGWQSAPQLRPIFNPTHYGVEGYTSGHDDALVMSEFDTIVWSYEPGREGSQRNCESCCCCS